MTTSHLPDLDQPKYLDADQLLAMGDEVVDLRIIDVRSDGEYQAARIPNSVCIPVDVFVEQAGEIAALGHPLVLVCQSGARASKAGEALRATGAEPPHVLRDGIVGWQSAGLPVDRGDNPRWAMDRQVRLVAGVIVSAGLATSTVFPPAKWLAGAIGAGLTYSALSNTCGMAAALSKLPYNRGDRHDFQAALTQLKANPGATR